MITKKSSPLCKNTFPGDQRNFPSGRKVKIFFEKLEKSYKRFNNPKDNQGLFYRLCGDSLPTKNANKGKIKLSSGKACMTGGERNAGEGCNKAVNSLQRPAGQPSVPSIKEGWKATTSSQLQGLAHIHTFETFQDVRAPSIK